MTPQPQHCDHECVCMSMPNFYEEDEPCTKAVCKHDTRSRPAPSALTQEQIATIRNQTLDEAITECEWDHPITQEDVWRKLESLRSTEAQQHTEVRR